MSIVKYLIIIALSLFGISLLKANDKDKAGPFAAYQLRVSQTEEEIKLDGILDESIWSTAERADDFMLNFPNDTMPASAKTEVMVTYDKQNLYIAAILHDDQIEEGFINSSLRRDFDFGQNDLFVVYIDPFNDATNGITFNITPYNVQREGLVFNGRRVDDDWDNVWYSATKIYDDRWVVEMSVPFKTFRFKDGMDFWKVNFGRNDLKRNERSTWIPVPINFQISSLNFTGTMNFDEPLKKNGPNLTVIPYAAGDVTRDYENNVPTAVNGAVGFDAKIGVTSSLNLDLTVNPDFSQVEVDQQQTNLNRFELFFPERRQFFLENRDLFAEFGFSRANPFFSRRIGIAQDTAGNTVSNRIIGGARLSGKINQNWRVGLLNMQTEQDEAIGIPSQNFTVATVQRQVFKRSNIGFIFVNRETTSGTTFENVDEEDELSEYNRVAGLDFNLSSNDNKWRGKAFYHQSFSPENQAEEASHGSFLSYSSRNLRIEGGHQYIGENFNAEVGFVPRKDIWRTNPEIEYSFYPKSEKLVSHGPSVSFEWITDRDFNLTDQRQRMRYNFRFANTAQLSFTAFNEYVLLRDSFDPTNSDGIELAEGDDFEYVRYGMSFDSDRRKLLSYSLDVFNGGFFNGERFFLRGELRYRFQPFGSISANFQYNKVTLPAPYSSADLYLVGPRLEVSFTDKLFWSTFIQYNNQIDNININTRLQYRFKPVSDFFIVYTDNYLPETLGSKNRALVLKLSYWLNI